MNVNTLYEGRGRKRSETKDGSVPMRNDIIVIKLPQTNRRNEEGAGVGDKRREVSRGCRIGVSIVEGGEKRGE